MLRVLAALAICLLAAPAPPPVVAHPIHTTMAQLSHDARSGEVRVVLRVFADDFGLAVAHAFGGTGEQRPMAAYLARHLVLQGPGGERIPLRWVEARQQAEVLWIRLRGEAPDGLRGGQLRNALVFDLHSDQVNIVKASYRGDERTLLFTRQNPVKRLP